MKNNNHHHHHRGRGRDDYEFVPLKVAVGLGWMGQKVNVLGSVVEFGLRRKSKGTDYVYTLKIVDDSYQDPAVAVNFFAQKIEELPHVKSAGDIIQLSHVVMQSYDGEVYISFNKKFSSFALFDAKPSNDFNPYQVSSYFQAKDCAKEFITRLRAWLCSFQVDAGTNKYLLSLKEIKERECFDLICKVLNVSEVSSDKWMLFVWDGTDTPPLNFETKLSDEAAETPLPLQLENPPLLRDILCTFPRVGSILRVFVSCEQFDLHLICSGQWVRLRSIICQVNSSFWLGDLMPSSKLRLLSEEDSVVAQRLRSYNERISSKWGRLPLCSSLSPSLVTATDHEHAPCVTLMDLLTYSEVTGKFKCVVRVISLYPCRAEHFRSPIGKREYRMRLTLEDPTARIHAFLYGEDGVKFFDGYPPIEVLRKKRNQLLGITTDEEEEGSSSNDEEEKNVSINPPWVQCCLKSYYSDKSDTWGSRNYRIFGTRIVDQTT
ncbi:Telomeric single stranded DNA binding POT1/Cdc13 [Macleaya cordata]|uniref:Protection of telomeres protein 1 n=1 Tax=Macleaya cordata TaxID=56857 RepID=A0A200PR49_MACCD|nr:Telomeric single stranded DNA binding POT1/Cdc13 [Macleaya cordata]